MKKWAVVLMSFLILALIAPGCESLEETPTPTPTPSPKAIVSIDAPTEVDAGSVFVARVVIEGVADFDAYRLDITYDPAIIQVVGAEGGADGVRPGVIRTTTVPVDIWGFAPAGTQGTVRVLGNAPGVSGVDGDGYLVELRFRAVGIACNTSEIKFSGGWLDDFWGEEIAPVLWVNDSVHLVGASPSPTTTPTPTPTPSPALSPTPTPTSTRVAQIPCRFYGTVRVDGAYVPDGTTIAATVGKDTYTTSTPSVYGPSTYRLEIEPPAGTYYADGLRVIFYIGPERAIQTSTWQTGGNIALDLSSGQQTPTPSPI